MAETGFAVPIASLNPWAASASRECRPSLDFRPDLGQQLAQRTLEHSADDEVRYGKRGPSGHVVDELDASLRWPLDPPIAAIAGEVAPQHVFESDFFDRLFVHAQHRVEAATEEEQATHRHLFDEDVVVNMSRDATLTHRRNEAVDAVVVGENVPGLRP